MSSGLEQLCKEWHVFVARPRDISSLAIPDRGQFFRDFNEAGNLACCVGCLISKQIASLMNGWSPGANQYLTVFWRASGDAGFLSFRQKLKGSPGMCVTVAYGIPGVPNPWGLKGTPPSGASTGSPASMDLVRRWVAECTTKHQPRCSHPTGSSYVPTLPTRVLDLGPDSSSTIVLRETNGACGQYICLSYCWGRATFINTTPATLESRKQGISLDELPRTFQDAVTITRHLGVRYLWIDALCIIQDDEDCADWKRESGTMANVYYNSFLTISATWADSAHGGCFHTPEPAIRVESLMVRRVRHFWDSSHFPVLGRGWTFQERMLARRVLHFGPQELLWECCESRACECGHMYHPETRAKKAHFDRVHFPPLSSEGPDLTAARILWREIVLEYSPLQLTNRSDKLAALSGLADRLQQVTGQEYCAGLWRDALLLDMCWQRGAREGFALTPRPSACAEQVPSWSWASVDGPIAYHWCLRGIVVGDSLVTEYAEVSDAKCALAGPSLTGPVRGGFIDLWCSLLAAHLHQRRLHLDGIDLGAPEPSFHFDEEVGPEEVGDFFLIPLILVADVLFGLIVKPNDERDGESRRNGLLAHGTDPEKSCLLETGPPDMDSRQPENRSSLARINKLQNLSEGHICSKQQMQATEVDAHCSEKALGAQSKTHGLEMTRCGLFVTQPETDDMTRLLQELRSREKQKVRLI